MKQGTAEDGKGAGKVSALMGGALLIGVGLLGFVGYRMTASVAPVFRDQGNVSVSSDSASAEEPLGAAPVLSPVARSAASVESAATLPRCQGRIRLEASGSAGVVAPNAPLPMTIASATNEHLVLLGADRKKCVLWLAGRTIDGEGVTPLPDDTAVANSDAPIPGSGGGISQGDFSESIQRLDEGHYQLDAEVVRRVLENGGDAVTEVELTPAEDGTRLGARTGVFAYLGLQEGDVLIAANNRGIESVDDLVQSFGSVSDENDLLVKIRREGKPLSIQYAVR